MPSILKAFSAKDIESSPRGLVPYHDCVKREAQMRKVGELTSSDEAKRFLSHLRSRGIEAEMRDSSSVYAVWILDDAHLEAAKEDLTVFLQQPNDARFRQPAINVQNLLKKSRPSSSSVAKAWGIKRRWLDSPSMIRVRGNYPLVFIGICAVFFLMQNIPGLASLVRYFFISEDPSKMVLFGEIRSGQIWRLVTPALLHGSILHFAFNMIWVFQLGKMIEHIEGSLYLLLVTLGFAAFSNISEYLWTGPMFIGASGVVYAYLGYVFAMSRYSSRSYSMDNFTMVFMVGWLILGISGVIGGIANVTHLSGLIVGSIFGLWRARHS
jgi:GlpG protein